MAIKNLYKAGLILVIGLAHNHALAESEIEGRVLGLGGAPIKDANVTVEQTGATTRTDSQGHFLFEDLSAGEYRLVIESEGDREERVVDLAEDAHADVTIYLTARRLEKLIVTASPFGDKSTLDLAQPVTVISGDALDIIKSASIGETLGNQLGVNSTYFGPAAGRPVIRGLTGNRVRVQQDGIGSLDVSALSPDHAVGVEPLLIDSVEIIKGPATLLYGNGAFGGVVNLIDNRIPEDIPHESFHGAVEVRGDTAADERTVVARFDGGVNKFAWHVDAFSRDTDDVEIPGFAESAAFRAAEEEEAHEEEEEGHDEEEEVSGTLENSDIDTEGGAAGITYITENGFIGISVSALNNNYGVPGHGHEEEEE
ncbi:MAG: TonB-dependent receptor plug domain-containing protein, partial [Gammaproteobacteria bacterium]|nr:TonB-dependent receptor plug domain-containing protein [Gammaproteobacteria bacterium]